MACGIILVVVGEGVPNFPVRGGVELECNVFAHSKLSGRYRLALILVMGTVGVVLLVCSSIFWLFDISHLTFKQVLVILFCGVGAMTTSVLLSQLEDRLFPAEQQQLETKQRPFAKAA